MVNNLSRLDIARNPVVQKATVGKSWKALSSVVQVKAKIK